MMEYTGDKIEQPPVLNDWLPYDDVTNSASACVGWIVRKYDYETGFEIVGVELSEQIEIGVDGDSVGRCINGWLTTQANEESYFKIDDWTGKLRQLTKICGVASLAN
jgi:hypothetical protein